MEMIFLFLALVLSKFHPEHPALPSSLFPPPESEAIISVWSRLYPALEPRMRRSDVSYLPDPDTEISAVAQYATDRLIWKNFLESQKWHLPESAGEGNGNPVSSVITGSATDSDKRVQLQIRRRLLAGARAALRTDDPPDAISPAARELATAYMDCADLGVPVRPPDPAVITSPALRSFFRLYATGTEREWRSFAEAASQASFRDAIHLVPRVPRQFLPQAFNLVDQIGSSADFDQEKQRATARALITLRLRMAGQ